MSDIFHLVRQNDIEGVKKLIKEEGKYIVNSFPIYEESHMTPIYCVRSVEMAKLLLDNEANIRGGMYKPPLTFIKDIATIQYLIDNGADINWQSHDGKTTLMTNVGNPNKAELLIKNGIKDKGDWSPLHFAETSGEVNKLIKSGIDVNVKRTGGQTPLHYAKNIEVIDALLNNGADLETKDIDGNTPLIYAISNYRPEEVAYELLKYLISKGAEVNIQDANGNTALHQLESTNIAKLFIKNGFDINLENIHGQGALETFCNIIANKPKKVQKMNEFLKNRGINMKLYLSKDNYTAYNSM